MSYKTFSPGDINTAVALITSAADAISNRVFSVKYPEILYPNVLPAESIETDILGGAGAIGFFARVKEYRGVGGNRATGSNDSNIVGVAQTRKRIPMIQGSVTGILDLQDRLLSENAQRLGLAEGAIEELETAKRIAYERHLERVVWYGDNVEDKASNIFSPGLLNNQNVPTTTVALGASGFTEWDTKTPDEILFDLQAGQSNVYSDTNTISSVNTILLPPKQMNQIVSTKAGTRANDETIARFVANQNINVEIGKGPLTFIPVRYLTGAGAGGTDRMIFMERIVDNFQMALPVPLENITPFIQEFIVRYSAQYRFSSVFLPYPSAFGYADGI